jgi:uncharacterized protein (DUF2126 family)/transglutaminase-like putative cysteine protease
MGIRVALHHRTRYQYDREVSLSPQVVRLRPAPHCRTPVLSYSLRITPSQHFLNWQQDPQGNFLARVVFPNKTRELALEVDLVAEMTVINPFDFFLEPEVIEFPFRYSDWLASELQPYRVTEPVGPKLASCLAALPRDAKGTVDYLVDINRFVHQQIRYVTRQEPGVQTCEETLSLRSGSCRDSAWLLVQILRNLGLASRFVSGYLIQLRPDVKPLDGPGGTDHDFTDLHAWTEVFLPGAGWVGLDPTSGLLTGEGHLPLAASPDFASAAPLTGALDPCETEFDFHMQVTRLHEDPRVTRPYSEEQWTRIQSVGKNVDKVLIDGDVRLTMGGEPTFVSIDDMEGAEWNTGALGEDKRKRAGDLFRRLANRFATGPLLHFGQGKWYPGESLPRWALGCFWRTDGEPIWRNPSLIAEDEHKYSFGEREAKAFVTRLAQRLGVDAGNATAGYEDAWYYLWKERRLPANVDPLKSNLADAEERTRLARVFEQGLDRVVGFTLPLRAHCYGNDVRWESSAWTFRTEHMFLIPGDSAMGYRLPLDSLLWPADKNASRIYGRDPFADYPPLPPSGRSHAGQGSLRRSTPIGGNGSNAPLTQRSAARVTVNRDRSPIHQMAGVARDASLQPDGIALENGLQEDAVDEWGTPESWFRTQARLTPGFSQSAPEVVRTALCVEPRQGTLYIFMPPVAYVEEYLDLVAAIEDTADELSLPVKLEGYTPPYDPRLKNFKVTPDPGVIEVNLQPSGNWDELVENTTVLYEEARLARLGTEKFMLDGRHTGTGGGNHIVLGGAKPSDSPFLRRPDVLRSLIAYWNNRPSLSYLFSGLFIGPTSQAPRADEARHETVYELQTALSLLPDLSQNVGSSPPWIVDRVLRNLLVDVTGNTHRAEFCIDKLYSPDSSSGRLGLVEFRAFEMPPHARMSLTQQLLVRALIARFWKTSYREPLVRWGTALHDRFLLPHFIAQDFAEVLDELTDAGYPFEQDWFASHFEFRFPICGQVTQRSMQFELRQAIEPWHVLGEEPGGGGAVRYVDSSLERLQIKASGLTDPRYVLACNGRRVPLHSTGTPGEFVAGVRFRAWQPTSCLHPTIGVHTPLVFDILDAWNGRSIGGCTWHVAHPGGRNFESFPVNAYEAESRRSARFFAMGHSPGPRPIPDLEHNDDYPFTLDLRRPIERATLNE